MSRSVRELEQILGHDLFDRASRGAKLTDRGKVFLEAAEAGLLQLWQGADAVMGHSGTSGRVRVGALPNVCSRFLPGVVHSFKSEFPEVAVQILPGTNAELLAALRRGEADFVIGRLSSSDDMRGLTFEALYDEALVLVVRAGHPLSKAPHGLQEALGYPVLLPPSGTIIRQEVDRFLAGQGAMQPTNTVETTSTDFLRAYLAQSDAVAFTPRGVIQDDLEQGKARLLDITGSQMRAPVGLTSNPDLAPSDAVRLMVQHIRNKPLNTKTGMHSA